MVGQFVHSSWVGCELGLEEGRIEWQMRKTMLTDGLSIIGMGQKLGVQNYQLGCGFNVFFKTFSPEIFGEDVSNLTIIFFRWVVQPPIRIELWWQMLYHVISFWYLCKGFWVLIIAFIYQIAVYLRSLYIHMEGSGMPDNIQIICNVTGMSLVLSKWVTTPL